MTCKHDNVEFIGIYIRIDYPTNCRFDKYVCWVRTIVCCKDCNVEIDPVEYYAKRS